MEPVLFLTFGENERLTEKAVFFSKFTQQDGVRKDVNLTIDNDPEVSFGELSKNCLLQLNNVMEFAYQPMIERLESKHWGKCD